MKIDKHIEVVRSGVPRLSSMGLKSCNMIAEVLSKYYRHVDITYVNNPHDLACLIDKKPDLAFIGFKSMPSIHRGIQISDDIWMSEELDKSGINYTGSTKEAMVLDHNKDVAKQVIQAAGLPTAPYFCASPGEYRTIESLPLGFPLFVKPPREGGGIGIDDDSIVRSFGAYKQKVATIRDVFGTHSLVEKYLAGREFSVAFLETWPNEGLLAMPIELISEPGKHGDRILSRKIKSDDSEHVTAVAPGPLRDTLNHLATSAFKAIGGRDYGRIDIRMDEAGELYFLEANLIPGLAMHDFTSYFTSACWINRAIDYDAMVLGIVKLGLMREQRHTEDIPASNMAVDASVLSLK